LGPRGLRFLVSEVPLYSQVGDFMVVPGGGHFLIGEVPLYASQRSTHPPIRLMSRCLGISRATCPSLQRPRPCRSLREAS